MNDDCVFCAIAAGESPSRTIYEDDRTVAFLDISPVTRGHTLVIPRRHADDIWDVEEDEAAAVMRTATRVAELLRDALQPEGCNLFQATRAIAGQTVFHLHLHVLPRYDVSELQVALGERSASAADLDAVVEELNANHSGRAGT